MHSNIASSQVYVHGNSYFIILGEWGVSSKMGQRLKLRLIVGVKPRENPNFLKNGKIVI